ncbi:nucleoside hydrolase [Paracoccus sp. JM45]|uniref:nucleoside hydrolase n=1 Tax=Paracoccus sp. JM45 TaxID=2283626 RepID=UPI000E6BB5B7|nr:nucleoside hydrolase [Paracoccus sp. JM45]RJE78626.1 nucleoside hydrolase [Paracoccus sp. JM45]
MKLWVDTDFGFDDLWALLLLRRAGHELAGVSLVAGNTLLSQAAANALGANAAYGLGMQLHCGAASPLKRQDERADRVLGMTGMQSRGLHLPYVTQPAPPANAVKAMAAWLMQEDGPRHLLALGPLTNIAQLIMTHPKAARRITRLVWMGGSNGPGNHSPQAEFNALADPEAASVVANSGIALDVIDLMICRTASFGPKDVPYCDPLTADLLGGYLDIGLSRGRSGMAIYDPVAALAMIDPGAFTFENARMAVSTVVDTSYGATAFTPDAQSSTRLAVAAKNDTAHICLRALKKDGLHGIPT